VNVAQFGLFVGFLEHGQTAALPYTDKFFWFGEGMIQAGDVIRIYTGSGENSAAVTADSRRIFTLYWGRPTTLFANSQVVPVLFRMGGVIVGREASDLSQVPQLLNDDKAKTLLGHN